MTWLTLRVQGKIYAIQEGSKRRRLQRIYDFLMANEDSSYSKFVIMQSQGVAQPFLYQIFTAPDYEGVKCAFWPSLYHRIALCRGNQIV